jgi:carboxypeptidase family protein
MAGRCRFPLAVRMLTLGLAVGAWSAWPTRGAGQQRTGVISGRLVDRESRSPIRGALIALLGSRRGFASDSEGRFARDSLSAGNYVLQVRAIGYVGASWVVQLAEGEVHADVFELERLPVLLDPVAVERRPSFAEERLRDFERRRAAGRGYFLTEEQIAQAGPRTLGDLFRNVPGVRMQCRGSTAGCSIRMTRAPRECRPDFVLDGFSATNATSLDMPTIGIIGIEIYRTLSETPLDLLRISNQCGLIVIWTRSGPG